MSEKQTLAVPVFIKVKDLEKARSGFNVYVKVAEAKQKDVPTRDGQTITMVDCLLVDQTASVKAFFKGDNAKLITEGAVIAVRNGLKRYVQNKITVQVDIFGRVTAEKGVKIDAGANLANISDVEHILESRPPRDNRRDNRGGRRTGGRRQGDDRRGYGGDRREDRGPRRQPRQDRGDREYKRNDRDQGRKPERERVQKTETDKPVDRTTERKDNRNNDKPERDNRGNDRRDNRNYDNRDNRDNRTYERRDNRNYDNRDNRDTKTYERRDNRNYDNRDNRDNRDTRNYERRDNRQYEKKTYDQDYNRNNSTRNETRPARQYEQKRQENRQGRAPFNWAHIKEISPGDSRLNLNVQVISVVKVGRNTRVIIGDNTGISNAFLHDSEDLVTGESIVLFNAKAEVVKEHIEIQLQRGGRFERSRKPVSKVNEQFNLSEKAWVPVE